MTTEPEKCCVLKKFNFSKNVITTVVGGVAVEEEFSSNKVLEYINNTCHSVYGSINPERNVNDLLTMDGYAPTENWSNVTAPSPDDASMLRAVVTFWIKNNLPELENCRFLLEKWEQKINNNIERWQIRLSSGGGGGGGDDAGAGASASAGADADADASASASAGGGTGGDGDSDEEVLEVAKPVRLLGPMPLCLRDFDPKVMLEAESRDLTTDEYNALMDKLLEFVDEQVSDGENLLQGNPGHFYALISWLLRQMPSGAKTTGCTWMMNTLFDSIKALVPSGSMRPLGSTYAEGSQEAIDESGAHLSVGKWGTYNSNPKKIGVVKLLAKVVHIHNPKYRVILQAAITKARAKNSPLATVGDELEASGVRSAHTGGVEVNRAAAISMIYKDENFRDIIDDLNRGQPKQNTSNTGLLDEMNCGNGIPAWKTAKEREFYNKVMLAVPDLKNPYAEMSFEWTSDLNPEQKFQRNRPLKNVHPELATFKNGGHVWSTLESVISLVNQVLSKVRTSGTHVTGSDEHSRIASFCHKAGGALIDERLLFCTLTLMDTETEKSNKFLSGLNATAVAANGTQNKPFSPNSLLGPSRSLGGLSTMTTTTEDGGKNKVKRQRQIVEQQKALLASLVPLQKELQANMLASLQQILPPTTATDNNAAVQTLQQLTETQKKEKRRAKRRKVAELQLESAKFTLSSCINGPNSIWSQDDINQAKAVLARYPTFDSSEDEVE